MRTLALAAVTLLIPACSSTAPAPVATVTPDFETVAVSSEGDAADDPAILVGANSVRLLGTDKRSGLALYDLTGAERAFLASGRVNNVDAVHQDGNEFLAAASNRTEISLDLYRVDAERIELVARQPLAMTDPYGLCMGETPETSVFVGDKEGRIEHWMVGDDLVLELRQQFQLEGQTEGCVFDPTDGTLYIGEEERGIWAIDLASGERRLIAAVDRFNLVMDVEGLDIYHRRDAEAGSRYLVASSQGDNSYLIYAIPGGEQLLKFRIVDDADAGIDGSEETDGLAVTSAALPGYPAGILVVQDGANVPERQNFKGVDWRKIQALLP
jgi:3-phytase